MTHLTGFFLRPAVLVFGLGLVSLPALAVQPDEILPDPTLESRAREISQGLRCVVCQSENIDESNADLARDMRLRVRSLLTEGRSNDEVVGYMVERYGDYVLMKPPFKTTTVFLWLGPFLALGAGAFGLWTFFRRRDGVDPALVTGLNEEEERRLKALLAEASPPSPSPSPAAPPPPAPSPAADKETPA
ncbi:cytochrome c-type biogenesis protein [Pararhodospirillum photometricum]|nr:cytochrome c-type biogenesis protein [Pararhodospirillum photometricum]